MINMDWRTKFYFWWRYADNPIAELFRQYNKFKLKAIRAKDFNYKTVENIFLYWVIQIYFLISYPYLWCKQRQIDKMNQPLIVTKEMMDKKIQELNKFYKR